MNNPHCDHCNTEISTLQGFRTMSKYVNTRMRLCKTCEGLEDVKRTKLYIKKHGLRIDDRFIGR